MNVTNELNTYEDFYKFLDEESRGQIAVISRKLETHGCSLSNLLFSLFSEKTSFYSISTYTYEWQIKLLLICTQHYGARFSSLGTRSYSLTIFFKI